MYAIVDIETTGGYAANNRITEIAIFIHDGNSIVEEYSSLVNPERSIPGYITGLTGISDKTVEGAPTFKEIASEVHGILKDKIFVAHNVHFDYSFVKKQLDEAGHTFNSRKLCTVRLSRRLIPGLSSYGLGNLAKSLGVEIHDRHRAGGDAGATAKIFHHLLQRDDSGVIAEFLKRDSRETKLPPNLPAEDFHNLPELPGVYYFLNKSSEVIYVGKAINIKKRIAGHFSGVGTTWGNTHIRNEICHITFELTGNELIAFLLEAEEIKRLWPRYNKAQKSFSTPWNLIKYMDGNGYQRLVLNKNSRGIQPVLSFHTHAEAWAFTLEFINQYNLCPKLCGIQKTEGACFDYRADKCLGACCEKEDPAAYNKRLEEAFKNNQNEMRSYIITGIGREEEEDSFILVDEGEYKGFGFIPSDYTIQEKSEFYNFLTPCRETRDSMQILNSFIRRELVEVREF